MKIDRDVEAPPPQPGGECEVVEQTSWAPASGRYDHFVKMRVPVKNRSG